MEGLQFLEEYSVQFGLDPSNGIKELDWKEILLEIFSFVGKVTTETKTTVLLVIAVSIVAVFLPKQQFTTYVLVGICGVPILTEFIKMVEVGRTGISDLTNIMVTAIPALFSLNFSGGTGVFLFITQLLGILMLYVFFPLILCQTALGISESITGPFNLKGLKQSVRSLFSWGLGLVMLVFSVSSAISGSVLGVSATSMGRSLRYAGSMIPVVGRYLAESAELIYAGSSVLISTGGVGVCIAVIGCMLRPFIRLFIYSLIYKFTAFCVRPFGEPGIVSLLDNVSEGLSGLAGLTILVAAIALINIAVIVRIVGFHV